MIKASKAMYSVGLVHVCDYNAVWLDRRAVDESHRPGSPESPSGEHGTCASMVGTIFSEPLGLFPGCFLLCSRAGRGYIRTAREERLVDKACKVYGEGCLGNFGSISRAVNGSSIGYAQGRMWDIHGSSYQVFLYLPGYVQVG